MLHTMPIDILQAEVAIHQQFRFRENPGFAIVLSVPF
jgi:hypothetical protein